MATELASLIIEIKSDGATVAVKRLDDLESTSNKAEKATDKLRNSTKKSSRAMKKYGKIIGATAVGATVLFIKNTLQADDQIAKLAKRLNISTEALSEYQHVAKLSGVAFSTLTAGFQRMGRRVSEAAKGSGEARGALQELNLSAEDLNKLTLDQQFEIIADRINGLGNESDKTRLAMRLFDSEGVALVQLMGEGSAGIRKMRQEARDLGLALDSKTASAVEKINDDLTRLEGQLSGTGRSIVHELIPAFELITKIVHTAALEFIDLGDLLGSYAAIAARVIELDFEGAGRVIDMRKQERAALDEKIDRIWEAKHATDELNKSENKPVKKEVNLEKLFPADEDVTPVGDFGSWLAQHGEYQKKRAEDAERASKRLAEITATEIQMIRDSNKTRVQLENELHAQRQELLETAGEENFENSAERALLLEQEHRRHEEALTQISVDESKKRARANKDVIPIGDFGPGLALYEEYQNKRMEDAERASRRLAEITATELQMIRDSNKTRVQLENELHTQRREFLETAGEENFENSAERTLLLEQEQMRHEEALTQISADESEKRAQAERDSQKQKMSAIRSGLSATSSIFGSLASLVGKSSKKAFEQNKMLQRASVIASTAAGVMRTYSDLGPIAAEVAKGKVLLQGAASLAQINRTSFGGGGTVSGGGAGGAIPTSTPALPQQPPSSFGEQQGGGGANVNITVTGSVVGSDLEEIIANGMRQADRKDLINFRIEGKRVEVA